MNYYAAMFHGLEGMVLFGYRRLEVRCLDERNAEPGEQQGQSRTKICTGSLGGNMSCLNQEGCHCFVDSMCLLWFGDEGGVASSRSAVKRHEIAATNSALGQAHDSQLLRLQHAPRQNTDYNTAIFSYVFLRWNI